VLPQNTEQVWSFLKEQPALAGFVLVGGSALALRLQHRLSEDLDLVWSEQRLPRARLEALCRVAGASGFDLQRQDDEATTQEFADAGLVLHEYQQNYLVNQKVKVSFFAPEPPLAKVLKGLPEPTARVATLEELFKAKCLVSASRSKTRDWIDLYLLLREHNFTLRDYRAAFEEAGVSSQCDTGLSRLCSGVPQKDDEGYAHLLSNPPTLEEMKAYFTAQRNKLEVELAAEAARRRQEPNGGL
jgi:Nucleotidyl transferase AbiEii toxin, Type IV TA system